MDVYPTLAHICGLNVPQGLVGISLKRYLEHPVAPMQKPAISVYSPTSKNHGGNLMGYSVRTERWRCTFWRKRNAADMGFIELYDEQNDPNEPRDQRYDRLYPGKLKLTEAEYLAAQGSDKGEAKARFAKLDADQESFLSREDFIRTGKRK